MDRLGINRLRDAVDLIDRDIVRLLDEIDAQLRRRLYLDRLLSIRRGRVACRCGCSCLAVVFKGDETFTASPAEESELIEAIAEADRGQVVDGWELLRQVQSSR